MRDVIAKNFLFDFMKCRANGIDLRQYIHAITVIFYHPKQTANLTLNAAEAFGDLGFGDIVHGSRSLIPYVWGVYRALCRRSHVP